MSLPASWYRPKLACKQIEQVFPGIPPEQIESTKGGWTTADATKVAAVFGIVDGLDPRVLGESLAGEDRHEWIRQFEELRSAVTTLGGGGAVGRLSDRPARALYGLLRKCTDEPKPVELTRLSFIGNPKLQEVIARDIDAVGRLMLAEEWKAATVLGGSVLEAILLGKLENRSQTRKALAFGTPKGWKADLARWDLCQLIEAAKHLKLIDDSVAGVCLGVRHFRNMIHPGKERAEITPDGGTAHVAYGAILTC